MNCFYIIPRINKQVWWTWTRDNKSNVSIFLVFQKIRFYCKKQTNFLIFTRLHNCKGTFKRYDVSRTIRILGKKTDDATIRPILLMTTLKSKLSLWPTYDHSITNTRLRIVVDKLRRANILYC